MPAVEIKYPKSNLCFANLDESNSDNPLKFSGATDIGRRDYQQDTAFLKTASQTQSQKSDAILKSVGDLSVVSKVDFDTYKKEEEKWKEDFALAMDKRFKKTENYLSDSKSGITFANALVSRWTTFLVLLILTAAVIVIVGKYIPIGG